MKNTTKTNANFELIARYIAEHPEKANGFTAFDAGLSGNTLKALANHEYSPICVVGYEDVTTEVETPHYNEETGKFETVLKEKTYQRTIYGLA